MPTTKISDKDEKAHELSRKIENARPHKHDKDAQDENVSGGFNQKSVPGQKDKNETSASDGDGQ